MRVGAFNLTFLNKTSLSVRSFQALCSNDTQLRYLQKTSLSFLTLSIVFTRKLLGGYEA
ncbi:hypothetical protein Syun_026706 [Stephania yunnanensis]|uniref:Uncharacterized protein n=1 Tax=Stephania yunnanensis TaxID=152371 RepID=A0AAP0HWZ2_9MAGN